MSNIKHLFLPLLFVCAFLVGCEDEEADAINAGQECLNKATIATAINCLSHVSGLTSSESYIIRCSARMLDAGIDETAIITAWDAADAAPSDDFEATLISNLGNSVELAGKTGNDTALAFDDCVETGVGGLIYISGVINIGTQIAEATAAALDPDAWIDNCEASPETCDDNEVGEVAIAVADSYCVGDNKNTEICVALESAIANGNGDPDTIGENLFNLIDPNTGT